MLFECLSSIAIQKVKDYEVIIVFEGILGVQDSFNFNSLTSYKLIENNIGERSAGRNIGLTIASGRYICFIDDDDLLKEDYLQDFYNFLIKNDFSENIIIRTSYLVLNQNDLKPSNIRYLSAKQSPSQFALTNFIGLWSLCIPATIAKSTTFENKYHYWEDTHYITRILRNSKFHQMHESNYIYRIHSNMGSKFILDECESLKVVKNNIECINNLFENYASKISELTPSLQRFLLSEKYIQYATKFILEKKYKIGFNMFLQSIRNGVYFRNYKYYFVFVRNLISII